MKYYAISFDCSKQYLDLRTVTSILFNSIRKCLKDKHIYGYIHQTNEQLYYLLEQLGMKITDSNFPDKTINNIMLNDSISRDYKDSQWSCFWFSNSSAEEIINDNEILATTIIYFNPLDVLDKNFVYPGQIPSRENLLQHYGNVKNETVYETDCDWKEILEFIKIIKEAGTDIIRICYPTAGSCSYERFKTDIIAHCYFHEFQFKALENLGNYSQFIIDAKRGGVTL